MVYYANLYFICGTISYATGRVTIIRHNSMGLRTNRNLYLPKRRGKRYILLNETVLENVEYSNPDMERISTIESLRFL